MLKLLERYNVDESAIETLVERHKSLSVVSMFSGCGGMDLGFLGGFSTLGTIYPKNRYKIIWANDFNQAACRTYRANLGHDVHVGSIWDVMHSLPVADDVDVVIGGFPCQDISVNGKRQGISGNRSGLYRAMVEVVKRVKPKAFVAENVKGLLMKHNHGSLEIVMNDFRELGYDVSYHLYHAADYGVPQSRERVFIVGVKSGLGCFTPPVPSHSPEQWISASQALSDLEDVAETEAFNHVWSKAKRSGEQGNRRLKPDRVAYTIRAECHGNIQYHYNLDRRISMREAARIQSFPDNFIFHSKIRETERQVGNAVPPVLAWHVARRLAEVI